MKELFKAIVDTLSATSAVTDLLGGANIWHGQIPAQAATPCVAFDLWAARLEPVAQAKGNRDPQHIAVRFSIVARDGDSATYGGSTLVTEIAEQLKAALHGADIGHAAMQCYAALFDDFQSPAIYDDAGGEWRCDLRFRFVVRKT